MEYKKFIIKCEEKNIFPSTYVKGNMSWDDWKDLAELTTNIDFGCKFVRSVCIKNTEYGCCDRCYARIGFHWSLPYYREDRELMAELFINKPAETYKDKSEISRVKNSFGFWRKNKGCILPRRLRSVTCLRACCADSSAFAKIVMNLVDCNESSLKRIPTSTISYLKELQEQYNLR